MLRSRTIPYISFTAMERGREMNKLMLIAPLFGAYLGGLHVPKMPLRTAFAAPETASVTIRWPAVTDVRGDPVTRYLVKLTSSTGQTLYSDSTTFLSDTVKIARPLPGDSIIVTGQVAARDRKGQLSQWGSSNPLKIPGRPWIPPIAPSPSIDTLALTRPDSAWLLVEKSNYPVKQTAPQAFTLVAGDTVHVCAYSWRGGHLEAGRAVDGWRSTDVTLIWPVGSSSLGSHCEVFATNPNVSGSRRLVLPFDRLARLIWISKNSFTKLV